MKKPKGLPEALLQPEQEPAARAAIAEILTREFLKHYGAPANDSAIDRMTRGIIHRDARALEHLANGLNEAGKNAFSAITGIALPPQQGKTWEALRAWGGISDAAEALHNAQHNLEIEKGIAQRIYRDNTESLISMINTRLDTGFDRVVHHERSYYQINSAGEGFNLSTRGAGWSKARPLIEAMIAERAARAAVEAENAAQPGSPEPDDEAVFDESAARGFTI
jgi:hypothetical protein